MKARVRFGPAGVPIQCKGNSTLEGVKCCKELGLDAMEMEFVQGVRLGKKAAEEIGKTAKELDISLSSHAPYFINFCSKDKTKITTSARNLKQAAEITNAAGGRITVFHPGYYQGQTSEEAYKAALKNIRDVACWAREKKIKTLLGAETVGKKSQFGGFEEAVRLSKAINGVVPVLDFAHLHARRDFNFRTADDYRKMFDILDKEIKGYVKNFHFHFSEIEYSEKGERHHLVLGEKNEPPLEPLLRVIVENGYSGTIICETPQIDIDAQNMQKKYNKMVNKK